MHILKLHLSVALIFFGATHATVAQNTENGRRLSERWCSECHAIRSTSGKFRGVPSFAAIAAKESINSDMIASFLLLPHATMPNPPLTRKDAEDIAVFIVEMKKWRATMMHKTRMLHVTQTGRGLAHPKDLPVLTGPTSTASQAVSHCLKVWRRSAKPGSRSGGCIMCLIAALVLSPVFTAAGRAQPPSAPAEISTSSTLASLVKKVIPSVVGITVRARAPVQEPIFVDPEAGFPDAPYQSTDRVINAAGVVIDGRGGLILTSAHVIEHADDISVTLSDGRRFQGSRVDTDPDKDIAVIRIDAADLVELPMANSDTLEVGDYVVAVGNPFGMGITVSHGIVSALHRSGLHLSGYQDFIQTDASLNPGNSGGPIVNLRGELVGIATAITSPTGSSIGIGFAVPVKRVRELLNRTVKYGEAWRIRYARNSAGSDRPLLEAPASSAH